MSRVLAMLNFKLLGFAIISMVVVLGVAISQLFETMRFIEMLSSSHQRTLDFRQTRTLLLDAETSQRGFLLTGREEYLRPWQDAWERFPSHISSLLLSCAGFPAQEARAVRLRAIATDKLEEVRTTIELRRQEGLEAALPRVQLDAGKQMMDETRQLVEGALQDESATQQVMREQQLRGVRVTTFLIIASALLCFAAGVNGFLLYQKARKATRLQRRALLQRRRALNADREKNLFMANMSHEIRTPMNAIIGFSQLLREEVVSPRARHYVNAIGSAGENLLCLINDVLDLSKIEAGRVELKPEITDLREVVQGLQLILSERASANGIRLLTEVAEDVPAWLMLDPLRLRQMLMNLLGNAVKFTHNGQVSLRVKVERPAGDGDSLLLVIEVEDTGRGIAPGDLEEIFKPFRQGTRNRNEVLEGTGLGLSITRRLAQLMGGKISAVSQPGQGSTFTLLLPGVTVAHTGPEPVEGDGGAVGLDTLAPMRVLIVDDNAHNREVMGAFFMGTHHEAAFATNGLEAVEMAMKHPPDLILMDIRMPRLDGREATELIRRHESLARTPVIAVTASSLTDSQSTSRASFDGYLRKPFLRQELIRVIRQAVTSKADQETTEASGFLPDDAAITPLEPAAAAQLRQLLEERWPHLTRTMAVRAVRSFADDLEELAISQHCPTLRDYAGSLKTSAATYQISRMEKSLVDFPELVDTLAPSPTLP